MNYIILIIYIILAIVILNLILILANMLLFQKEMMQLKSKISQETLKENKYRKTFERNHSNINPVSFNNPIQARKNLYDEYKNEKGLYEPVTPRKGIEIEEDK